MSQLQHENPFENVGSRVIDALGEFDKERGELYDALSTIAVDAQDESEYHLGITEQITKVALAMQDLAHELLKADGVDGSKEQLAKLWRSDDDERVKLFKDLAECKHDCFEGLEASSAEAMVDELYSEADDENELSEEIFDKYRAYLAGDIYIFAGHIQSNRDAKGAETALDVEDAPLVVADVIIDLHKVRRAALGMATVALGIAGGLALDRFVRKQA